MQNNKYKLLLPIVAAVFLIIGLWAGRSFSNASHSGASTQKLFEVFNILSHNYVDEVDLDSLVELTIPELIRNLDPHSNYLTAEERIEANRDLESSFFGIGIQFQIVNDTLVVFEVVSGGPAEEAGVLAGDKIIEVNGETIAGVGLTNDDVIHLLRGPQDTEVSITVKRSNTPTPLHFDLIRDEVSSSPIDAYYMLNDSIGFIRVGRFADNTYIEFIKAIARLKFDGANSLVIDLRDNGGGYMLPAVLMANEFLGINQTIVSTKGRTPGDNRTISSDGHGSFSGTPLVILINEFTASASEIFAGAMQDNDRALIVGRRSFGKGLVQNPFELSDSSELRLTVQRYYTPSGRSIQKVYTLGNRDEYDNEVYNRYSNGELFSLDSVSVDSTQIFHTVGNRPVYGAGGIMPDVFVPGDTSNVTNYYIKVANAGLIRDYAYEYADLNRENLAATESVDEMLSKLPNDYIILQSFVNYAQGKGVAPRWYYINTSAPLIVNQIKALIARDIHGLSGYYEIANLRDPVVQEALSQLSQGAAQAPIRVGAPND